NDPMPPIGLQYADYASWQRQHVTADLLGDQLEFWRRSLSFIPEWIQLPTDRPRTASRCYSVDRVQLRLSTDLTRGLSDLARQNGVTLFVTLLSGWALLLARWS